MYLHNKYTNWYYNIVTRALSRQNFTGYSEKHHIIPKSLGGSNSPTNLVTLTPKEHYVCHLLLTKMVTGVNKRKMWYASYMMMHGANRHKPSARMYQLTKENMIRANTERPGPNLGKVMSLEQKLKISLSQKGKPKKPWTEEQKVKARKPKSAEHKQKLSEARQGKTYGYKHSDETKSKIKLATVGKKLPKIICEHCGTPTSKSNYARWHGYKCKSLPTSK